MKQELQKPFRSRKHLCGGMKVWFVGNGHEHQNNTGKFQRSCPTQSVDPLLQRSPRRYRWHCCKSTMPSLMARKQLGLKSDSEKEVRADRAATEQAVAFADLRTMYERCFHTPDSDASQVRYPRRSKSGTWTEVGQAPSHFGEGEGAVVLYLCKPCDSANTRLLETHVKYRSCLTLRTHN